MDRVAIPTWFLGGRRHPARVALLCIFLDIRALRSQGFVGRKRSRVSERKFLLRLFGVREIEDSRARRQRKSDWVAKLRHFRFPGRRLRRSNILLRDSRIS